MIERGWERITQYCGGMSRQTIIELYREEGFPMKKVRRRWAINTSEVDRWFNKYDENKPEKK